MRHWSLMMVAVWSSWVVVNGLIALHDSSQQSETQVLSQMVVECEANTLVVVDVTPLLAIVFIFMYVVYVPITGRSVLLSNDSLTM